MSKKSIPWNNARQVILSNPEVRAAYEEEVAREAVQLKLAEWRANAGLTSSQVAERLGVAPSTISRLENNGHKAALTSLLRYAKACGVHHPILSFNI